MVAFLQISLHLLGKTRLGQELYVLFEMKTR